MATAAQLDRHRDERRAHGERVAAQETRVRQSLALAAAQLAASLARDGRQYLKADVTQRVDFDPAVPADVLTPDEHQRLAEAQLVVNAIADHIDARLRLQNQVPPHIRGGTVVRGRV